MAPAHHGSGTGERKPLNGPGRIARRGLPGTLLCDTAIHCSQPSSSLPASVVFSTTCDSTPAGQRCWQGADWALQGGRAGLQAADPGPASGRPRQRGPPCLAAPLGRCKLSLLGSPAPMPPSPTCRFPARNCARRPAHGGAPRHNSHASNVHSRRRCCAHQPSRPSIGGSLHAGRGASRERAAGSCTPPAGAAAGWCCRRSPAGLV